MNKDFFEVKNRYLADGLAFLGYRYYKFTNYDGELIYSFKRTDELLKHINVIYEMKNEVNNN